MARRTEKHEPVTEHGHGNLAPHVVIPPVPGPMYDEKATEPVTEHVEVPASIRVLRQQRFKQRADDGEDIATEPIQVPQVKWSAPGDPTSWEPGDAGHAHLPLQAPQSLAERLAQGSADDVEAALRAELLRMQDWRHTQAGLAHALLSAADLCAAVREHPAPRERRQRVDHLQRSSESSVVPLRFAQQWDKRVRRAQQHRGDATDAADLPRSLDGVRPQCDALEGVLHLGGLRDETVHEGAPSVASDKTVLEAPGLVGAVAGFKILLEQFFCGSGAYGVR
jgi:hypothetical protein